jgi:hypothetical protein
MSAEPVPPAGPIVGFDGSDEVASFGIVPALVWAFRIHEDLKITAEQRQNIGRVRRTSVKAHCQLAGLRALFNRLEHLGPQESRPQLRLATGRLAQYLDSLDRDIVEIRERAQGLQEEVTFTVAEAFPVGRDRAVSARDLGDRRIRNERQGPTAARVQRRIHLGPRPDGWFSSWRLRVATLVRRFQELTPAATGRAPGAAA